MMATVWRFAPLLVLAVAWEAVTWMHLISEFALPRFSNVLISLVTLIQELAAQAGRSMYRGGVGFLSAVVFGVLSGVLMAWYKPVRMLLDPLMRCFYPMPKSALIPLTIMWIGLGDASKMTLIFIGCLLPIVLSSYNAARGVDKALLWSARGMGATELEVLWEVVVPASLPEILSGIRISLALSFILMVSAEMIIANNGIGYLISVLGEGGDYAGMFAGVITVSAIGFFADRLFVMLTNRILVWRESHGA